MSYHPNNKQISVSIFPNLEKKKLYTYDASGKRNDEMQSQIHPKKKTKTRTSDDSMWIRSEGQNSLPQK